MIILVLGANGFLGSAISKKLLDVGHTVIGVKRQSSNLSRLKNYEDKIKWVILNEVNNLNQLDTQDVEYDVVINAVVEYGRDDKSISKVLEANLLLPIKMLEININKKNKFFLNIDTFYGVTKNINNNLFAYQNSKKDFLKYARKIINNSQTKLINVVVHHIYGPGDSEHKFIPSVIESISKNKVELDLTHGNQKRDFIYIDDVADAINIIIDYESKNDFSKPMVQYELGTGTLVKIRDFVLIVKNVCKTTTKLNFGKILTSNEELKTYTSNIKKITELGWSAAINVETGIKKIINSNKN